MQGNVWQWIEDCYKDSLRGAPVDGSVWKEACQGGNSFRVVRGGCWSANPQSLRSANRIRLTSVNRFNNNGFRVARTPETLRRRGLVAAGVHEGNVSHRADIA